MDKNQINQVARMLTEDPDVFSETFVSEMPKLKKEQSTTSWLQIVAQWKKLKAAVNDNSMTEEEATKALEAFKQAMPPSSTRFTSPRERGLVGRDHPGVVSAKEAKALMTAEQKEKVKKVIAKYTENWRAWKEGAKEDFLTFKDGGNRDFANKYYPDWNSKMFEAVLDGVGTDSIQGELESMGDSD